MTDKNPKLTYAQLADDCIIIGCREWAALPEFGVNRINAKVDTGAKTSAIHAFRPKVISSQNGEVVEFYLHPRQRRKTPEILCRSNLVDRRIVRSSNGQEEERLVIRTDIKVGEKIWPIDLTLANRDAMGFRLLLGRDALKKGFIIDPSANYLLGDKRKRKSQ